MGSLQDGFRSKGLTRPSQGRVLGGVCAGLGQRFGIAPWPARWLFLIVLLVVPGSQLIVYPVLWILMPPAEADRTGTAHPDFRPPA
jgi:phage shock protein PspC (stress-responsive transcriptional regulator)